MHDSGLICLAGCYDVVFQSDACSSLWLLLLCAK
jgi:hypothetical protein